MTSKKTTLYSSFLPIILLVGIIVGVGYFLLNGEFRLPKIFKDGTEVRRLTDYPTAITTNEILEKQRVVITSEEELNNFLDAIDSSGNLVLAENINFEKEMLLGVSTETLKTNGYELKVKRIYADKDAQKLLVSLRETRPGETCIVDQETNAAVDLVAITKTDWEIDFERVKVVDEC